jgi:hypothetical protein
LMVHATSSIRANGVSVAEPQRVPNYSRLNDRKS